MFGTNLWGVYVWPVSTVKIGGWKHVDLQLAVEDGTRPWRFIVIHDHAEWKVAEVATVPPAEIARKCSAAPLAKGVGLEFSDALGSLVAASALEGFRKLGVTHLKKLYTDLKIVPLAGSQRPSLEIDLVRAMVKWIQTDYVCRGSASYLCTCQMFAFFRPLSCLDTFAGLVAPRR